MKTPQLRTREQTTSQRTRFIEAARELCADEGEATFKAKLAVIGRQKPMGKLPEPPEIPPIKPG